MGVESALPYVAMVICQFAQVGLLIASKEAMKTGMTTFVFTFYSSAFASAILLPSSFLFYRSSRPSLSINFFCGCFILGLLGYSVQIIGNVGVLFASASLASAMLNLIPGFTFVLAVIFRMEKLNCRSLSTQAKSIGTVATIIGALVATLYLGPPILSRPLHSAPTLQPLTQSKNWILGGSLLGIDCLVASLFIIAQAFVLKRYPVELIVMFFYSSLVAVLSAATSFIIERDFDAWNLKPKKRLFAVIYAGCFGNVFQVTITSWCVRKKGPLFAALFHPLGIVIATALGVIFLGDIFYLGSLIGSVIIVSGFYAVMWGKATEKNVQKMDDNGVEESLESGSGKVPLLVNKAEGVAA